MLINSLNNQNKTIPNPAELYIKSLQSNNSKILMSSRLNVICKKMTDKYHFENVNWSILNYELVLDLLSCLKKEDKAPSTINSYLAAIKGVTKQAWKSKLISTDTYLWINDIKDTTGSRINKGRTLKTSEILKLIKACKSISNLLGKRDAAIIAISYGAGLRRDETANLKLENYDSENGTIKIIGKGNKERKNKLNKKIQKIINDWIEVQSINSKYLFCKIKDKCYLTERKITGNDIYLMLIRRYKEANIEKLSPHDLRRTYATNLLEQGEDLFIVQELMGHTRLDTTKKYDKRAEKFKDKAAESLPF